MGYDCARKSIPLSTDLACMNTTKKKKTVVIRLVRAPGIFPLAGFAAAPLTR